MRIMYYKFTGAKISRNGEKKDLQNILSYQESINMGGEGPEEIGSKKRATIKVFGHLIYF